MKCYRFLLFAFIALALIGCELSQSYKDHDIITNLLENSMNGQKLNHLFCDSEKDTAKYLPQITYYGDIIDLEGGLYRVRVKLGILENNWIIKIDQSRGCIDTINGL